MATASQVAASSETQSVAFPDASTPASTSRSPSPTTRRLTRSAGSSRSSSSPIARDCQASTSASLLATDHTTGSPSYSAAKESDSPAGERVLEAEPWPITP